MMTHVTKFKTEKGSRSRVHGFILGQRPILDFSILVIHSALFLLILVTQKQTKKRLKLLSRGSDKVVAVIRLLILSTSAHRSSSSHRRHPTGSINLMQWFFWVPVCELSRWSLILPLAFIYVLSLIWRSNCWLSARINRRKQVVFEFLVLYIYLKHCFLPHLWKLTIVCAAMDLESHLFVVNKLKYKLHI